MKRELVQRETERTQKELEKAKEEARPKPVEVVAEPVAEENSGSYLSLSPEDIAEAVNMPFDSLITDRQEIADQVNPLQQPQPFVIAQPAARRSETTTLPFAQRNSLFEQPARNQGPVLTKGPAISQVPERESKGPIFTLGQRT